MRILLLALLLSLAPAVRGEGGTVSARIVLQNALTAGLRHHEADSIWDQLEVGHPITLVREAGNPHDSDAVRVDWNGRVLGYLPRAQNRFVARQMDRGSDLRARIVTKDKYRNHRRKLEIEIFALVETRP